MNLQELIQVLNLKVFTCKDNLNKDVEGGYVSDLLSDVLADAKPNQIWITLQTHKNIVAIAQLKGLSAIVLVKGLEPNEKTIQKADEERIVLLGSDENKTEISKIENEAITKIISNVSLKSSRYLTLDNNNLYFTNGTGIYTLSKDLNSIPSSPIFNVNDNSSSSLYGFNVTDGNVLSSDASGFTDNSIITVYDLTWNVLKTFTTEIGTNRFYKN